MDRDALNQRLSQAIAEQRIPGAALAVQHGDRRIEVAAGWANVEAEIAADTRTIFQIGSITKAFTATLMLQLVEAGLVRLEAPVSTYLPDLKVAGRTPPDGFTLRCLLDYTAGIEGDFFGDFGPDPSALTRYVEACSDLIWVHAPGAMRSYGSTAYCIAGRVAEVVTGETFDALLRRRLIAPLGLSRACFFNEDVARHRTAVGHVWDEAAGAFRVAEKLRLPYALSPAGSSLTMTAGELLDFARFHMEPDADADARAEPLLSAASVALMQAGGRRAPPDDSELLMGWAAWDAPAGRTIVAAGATIEQNALVLFIPSRRLALSLLGNTAGAAERLLAALGAPLLSELLGEPWEIPAPPQPKPLSEAGPDVAARDLSIYAGRYRNSAVLEVVQRDGGLKLLAPSPSPALDLRPTAEPDRFVLTDPASGASLGVMRFVMAQDADKPRYLALSRRLYVRLEAPGAPSP